MSIQDLYNDSKPVLLHDFRNQISDIINPTKDDEIKVEPSSTTNIIVTKYADPTSDMLDVEPTLELDNKGKIIEVELLPSGHLRNIQNKNNINSIINKTVIKKVTKRKIDGTENKKVWEEGKKKRIKLCSVCGKEYVKNHELFCKPDGDNVNPDENVVCTKCRKEFPNVLLLKRHMASCKLHSLGAALCSKCGKHFSSNYNLKRHMTSCKLCPDVEKSPRYMCQCGRTYSQEWDMKKHKVKCKDGKKKCKRCLVANCNLLFYHKAQLIAHMKKDHNMSIQDPVVINFNSFEEFLQWKEKEEEETYTYYSKQTGSNVSGVSVNTYYVCQHDGSDRTHTSAPRKTGRRNKKGRIKTGRLCWSQMNVKQFKDGTVRVTYFPSHTHPLSISDTEHHPLPTSITMEIKRRLSEITNETEETQEAQEIKKGRRKRYGMTLRALRALARKNRSLFRITAEAIQKNDDKVEQPDDKTNIQFTPKFISSDENNLMQVFVTDNDDVDDPDELPPEQLNDSKQETTLEDCVNHINELKSFLESGKLDNSQISFISETLKNLVNKCKEEQQQQQEQQEQEQQQQLQQPPPELSVPENVIDQENQGVIMPSCQVMMSSSPLSSTEIFPMQDDVNMNNTELNDELKQLATGPEKAVYQIIALDSEEKQSNEFLYQNTVELVGGGEFIIIAGDRFFQSVDSNTQFDLT